MWNRVLLLASGMATGWTLVHLLTVSPEQRRQQATRFVLGLALGGVAIGLLTLSSPQAGLAGASVFMFSALVAYAANARQVSKVVSPPLLPIPGATSARDEWTVVLLVFAGQPEQYRDPGPWARQLRRRAKRGQAVPHWFVQPVVYSRIRAAYVHMGNRNPQQALVDGLAAELEARLGDDHTVASVLATGPLIAEDLAELAASGLRRIILVPIGFQSDVRQQLEAEVARSRIRELGTKVLYAAAPALARWSPSVQVEQLLTLAEGQPLPEPKPIRADENDVLEEVVRRADTQASA